MRKLIAYAAGDWHYPERHGGGAWTSSPDIVGDTAFALDEVVGLCVQGEVPLLAPGDLTDGPDPEPAALAAMYETLRRLSTVGVNVLYVLGNHERGRDWLAPLGGVAVNVSGRVVTVPGGVAITGLSYQPTVEAFVEATTATRRTPIGLYHQQWSELIKSGPYSIGQLPDHGLSVCGDVHVRAVLDKPQYPRRVLSTGPLSPQSIAEFDRPAVYAVYDDFSVREVAIKGRTFVRFGVESTRSAEMVMAAVAAMGPDPSLPKHVSRPVAAVVVSCHVPGFVDALEALAASRNVILRVTLESATSAVEAVVQTGSHEALRDAVMSWPAPIEARALAAALIEDGADPKAVVRNLRPAP